MLARPPPGTCGYSCTPGGGPLGLGEGGLTRGAPALPSLVPFPNVALITLYLFNI